MNATPKAGLHVTILTRKAADAHERRVYNIRPGEGMGWTPYKIVVTDRAMSYTAFHGMKDFRRWMGESFRVVLHRSRGIALGRIVAMGEA